MTQSKTVRDSYADEVVASISDGSRGPSITFDRTEGATEDLYSINAYDASGEMIFYRGSFRASERAAILALGRAIVEALATDEDGPEEGPSLPDDVCTCPAAELEYVTAEPHLPLDVEIRTIALDAAVRVLEHTGGSLVEGAAKVERFLLGQQDEPAEPTPRWTVGQELTADDLEQLPNGAVVVDRDGDKSARLHSEAPLPWLRNGAFAHPAATIAKYQPVILVSLP